MGSHSPETLLLRNKKSFKPPCSSAANSTTAYGCAIPAKQKLPSNRIAGFFLPGCRGDRFASWGGPGNTPRPLTASIALPIRQG
jgi:hypothetical protein